MHFKHSSINNTSKAAKARRTQNKGRERKAGEIGTAWTRGKGKAGNGENRPHVKRIQNAQKITLNIVQHYDLMLR